MGSDFWWFYDVVSVAILLFCIFINGRRGWAKSLVSFIGVAFSFIIALSVSSSISSSVYNGMIKNSNVKKINETLSSKDISRELSDYLETLGYIVDVNPNQIKKIFESDKEYDEQIYRYLNNINGKKVDDEEVFYEKLHDIYGSIMSGYISDNLNEYSAENARKDVIENPEKMNEFIELMLDKENKLSAAQYIELNYTAEPYKKIIRLIVFLIIFVIINVLFIFVVRSLVGKQFNMQGIGSHLIGGLIGFAYGGVFVVVAAIIVRLNVIMGSNEMLFFNFTTIDKTYIFEYVYNFVTNNM